MKKTFAIMITLALVLSLCACKKGSADVSDVSAYSETVYSSQVSDVSSETEETVSENVSEDASSETEQRLENSVSSKPSVTASSSVPVTSSKTPSKTETTQDKKPVPINFVPKQWSDIGGTGTFISYTNDVFYKGVRYACTSGKNNGTDCWAIVTVGENDEYQKCVSIVDTAANERGMFNVFNDRIYYLKFESNNSRDYSKFNSLSVCSMDLSGKDKRTEKKLETTFTHIDNVAMYSSSKYIFFLVSNLYENPDRIVYRYNMQTNEFKKLNAKLDSHKTIMSIGEKVFVYSRDDKAIFEYDIDFNNEKTVLSSDTFLGYIGVIKDGFVFKDDTTKNLYLLDLSGNIS